MFNGVKCLKMLNAVWKSSNRQNYFIMTRALRKWEQLV